MDTGLTEAERAGRHDGAGRVDAPPGFADALRDAEILLAYAAESGRLPREKEHGNASPDNGVSVAIVDGILDARLALESRALTKDVQRRFWVALSELSRIAHPVCAASLAACARYPIRWMKLRVLVLATAVILGSIGLFMNNSTGDEVMQLIDQQNAAALKLWSDLQYFKVQEAPASVPGGVGRTPEAGASERRAFAGAVQPLASTVPHLTPDELFGEIVEFSRKSNWLLETASRLNHWFNPAPLRVDVTPVRFEPSNTDHVTHLIVPPGISTTLQIVEEGLNQIVAYQLIRNYALATYKTNTVFYGGITTYLLPAVYALLGASLYGFRLSARLIRRRSFLPSDAHSARYFIALIAGIVIGLFGSLVPKELALPPLAVAFLVGYAVEAFFSRLDDIIGRFRKSPAARDRAAPEPADAAATD
jgi:hypothetical protein